MVGYGGKDLQKRKLPDSLEIFVNRAHYQLKRYSILFSWFHRLIITCKLNCATLYRDIAKACITSTNVSCTVIRVRFLFTCNVMIDDKYDE